MYVVFYVNRDESGFDICRNIVDAIAYKEEKEKSGFTCTVVKGIAL